MPARSSASASAQVDAGLADDFSVELVAWQRVDVGLVDPKGFAVGFRDHDHLRRAARGRAGRTGEGDREEELEA